MRAIKNFIQTLPKAELHIHLEGTLEPELHFKLADRNRIKLSYQTVEDLHTAYHFKDLQSFLDLYYLGTRVLVTAQDFYDLTWAYLERAHKQNVRYAEIFFDPQTHTDRGIAFTTIMEGIEQALSDAKKQFNLSTKLIMCFLRDHSISSAAETLEHALLFKRSIVAIGLDSAEINNPPSKFEQVFADARRHDFLTVAHAGEEGPPDYIRQALDLLKVSRIDHGIRCMEDDALVDRLISEQIPLDVCPLSNIKLCVFKSMHDHPIKKMLNAGLRVTVNSDDPAYFGGYINENYIAADNALDFTKQEIHQLVKNGFLSSFLSDSEKDNYISELDMVAKGIPG